MCSNKRPFFTFVFLFFLGMATLQGQGDPLPTGEVDVIKNFNARLLDAERITVTPQLPPLDTARKRMDYQLISKPLTVQYLPPRIRPISLDRQPQGDIYNGYARLGAGFPKAIFLDGAYDLISENDARFGVDVYHYGANNDQNVENQKFSNTNASLSGAFYNENGFAVNGQVGYKRDILHFYGYNELDDDFVSDLTYADTDVRQRFSTIYGNAQISNTQRTVADFDYRAAIDFYTMEDNYAARERGLNLTLSATKWFDEAHPLTVNLITDFTSFKDTVRQQLNNFFLQPSYTYHADRFKVKVGLNLASHEDEYYFYPDIEASANIVENILTAFVGANGSLQKNNFRNLTDYNPFLVSRIQVENSFYTDFFGGVKGEYLGFDYRAQVSYRQIDNLPLFLSNQDSIPRFNVLYDTASVISISGEIMFPFLPELDIIGSVTQRVYSLENQDKPWHLPSLTLNAAAVYHTPDNKINLRADLFLENGVPVPNVNGGSNNLNALFDISVSGEYMFNENIGGFIQLNNLAANNRQRWRNYPVMGINGVVGLSARF